jgi:hypothetical protein
MPEGPSDADLVVVGEGPGLQDVKQGRPFVGPSGVKLNEILRSVGLSRERVFLTNAMLCRAEVPGLQGPKRYETKTYLAWLRKENARNRKHASQIHGTEIKQIRLWLRRVDRMLAAGEPLDQQTLAYIDQAKARLDAIFIEIKSPLDCCAPRLWRELRHFEEMAIARHRDRGDRPNGAVVVPAGNFAALAVLGKAGIMKLRGSPIPVDLEAREEAVAALDPGPKPKRKDLH